MKADPRSRDPHSSRDRDIDGRLSGREQAMRRGRRQVRQESALSAGQHGRHPPARDREIRATHRIHPSMQRMHPPGRHAVTDGGATEPERAELDMGDDPVLAASQLEKPRLALPPIAALAELRSSIRRYPAIGGHG